MDKKQIFFISSYKEDILKDYEIVINEKEQNQYFYIPKEKNNDKYIIFVNLIEAFPDLNRKIVIYIEITEKKEEKNKPKSNLYNLEINVNDKTCAFIFEYYLKSIKEEFKFKKDYLLSYYLNLKENIGKNSEKFINEDFTLNEKFIFFFEYLLKTKDDIKQYSELYIHLVNNYIEEIKKNKEKEKMNIEILICILIVSYYEENYNSLISLIDLNFKEKEIDYKNINLILPYKEIFFFQITKILEKIKTYKKSHKNGILEIIIIYFIKFSSDNIKLLFDDKEIKEMIINVFKLEKTNYLNGEILDEKMTEIFINHCPNIESILGLLQKNYDYNSYLQNINKNFDTIYKEIKSLKSLKGLFNINCPVSQSNDLNVLVELHNSLL